MHSYIGGLHCIFREKTHSRMRSDIELRQSLAVRWNK